MRVGCGSGGLSHLHETLLYRDAIDADMDLHACDGTNVHVHAHRRSRIASDYRGHQRLLSNRYARVRPCDLNVVNEKRGARTPTIDEADLGLADDEFPFVARVAASDVAEEVPEA